MLDFRDIAEWPRFLKRPFSPPRDVRRVQDRRLRKVVRHAAAHVPYYRELFRRIRLDPRDIRTADDLQQLPVTGKKELQARPLADFLTEGVAPEGMVRLTTSGSTGEPTVVIRSSWEQYMLQAVRLRSQVLNGVRPRDLRLEVAARWRRSHPFDRIGLFRMRHAAGSGLDNLLGVLRRLRPDVLMSRASVLQMIAREAADASTSLPPCRLIFVGGELLTPAGRTLLESAWRCRVLNEYASNEAMLMAYECRHCGAMHTVDDAVVIEVLAGDRPTAPGELGRVVGTTLHSFVMPFIRFDFGDVAHRPLVERDCRCGFGSLDVLEGREMEFLKLPGGGTLSPYTVQRTIQGVSGVGRFVVRQESLSRVKVLVERSPSAGRDLGAEVRRELSAVFPPDVELAVEMVSAIQPSKGKFRYIESAIGEDGGRRAS